MNWTYTPYSRRLKKPLVLYPDYPAVTSQQCLAFIFESFHKPGCWFYFPDPLFLTPEQKISIKHTTFLLPEMHLSLFQHWLKEVTSHFTLTELTQAYTSHLKHTASTIHFSSPQTCPSQPFFEFFFPQCPYPDFSMGHALEMFLLAQLFPLRALSPRQNVFISSWMDQSPEHITSPCLKIKLGRYGDNKKESSLFLEWLKKLPLPPSHYSLRLDPNGRYDWTTISKLHENLLRHSFHVDYWEDPMELSNFLKHSPPHTPAGIPIGVDEWPRMLYASSLYPLFNPHHVSPDHLKTKGSEYSQLKSHLIWEHPDIRTIILKPFWLGGLSPCLFFFSKAITHSKSIVLSSVFEEEHHLSIYEQCFKTLFPHDSCFHLYQGLSTSPLFYTPQL